jgi:hypothetical protein
MNSSLTFNREWNDGSNSDDDDDDDDDDDEKFDHKCDFGNNTFHHCCVDSHQYISTYIKQSISLSHFLTFLLTYLLAHSLIHSFSFFLSFHFISLICELFLTCQFQVMMNWVCLCSQLGMKSNWNKTKNHLKSSIVVMTKMKLARKDYDN